MNFLTPLAFILAITLPIIIAMYLLKLRRIEQEVSSTYLWQRMVRDVEANAPWQRLRRNLLLLLQLAFLLLLILSLVRPFTWAAGRNSQATILILDTSASMAATDVPPSRLESAKRQAASIVSNLPEDSRTTLIAAGGSAQVLVSSSTDRRLILQALESLQPNPTDSDLAGALELASAIAVRQPESQIVILSDGRNELPSILSIQGQLRYILVGESRDNQAITLFSLEPSTRTDTLTAFAQVVNFSEVPVTRRLSFYADNMLVDAQDLELPASGGISVISEVIPVASGVVEAVLGESDFLALDDRAWALPPDTAAGDQLVTLVSPGNRFMETALGLLPGVEIEVVAPGNWQTGSLDPNLPTLRTSDLTIFDSQILTGTLPAASLFFIYPLASTSLFTVTGELETPIPKAAVEGQALLAHVDLSQVTILDSARIPLPDWARPIIQDETSGYPLLFTGEVGGQRLAVLSFDPRRSDLPLQPAFPILVANLVGELLPGRLGDVPAQIKPGDPLTFRPPTEIETLSITRPDGSSAKLDIRGGTAVFADTNQLGVYQVAWNGGSLGFVTNLMNPQESDIKPVASPPQLAGTEEETPEQDQQARREWWRPLAGLALIVLLLEWLVYQRATLTRVIHSLPFFHPSRR
jgi:hypothetical protein